MNATVEDLRPTIVPKSDQLNAEQLLSGSMTVTVTRVDVSNSPEQPVTVHYEGENGRPFKPCKTMRKLLVFAWGENGLHWAGRSMTLYCDPSVKFGGDEVGGIRISHLSDIERNLKVSLTATRGKKTLYTVQRLEVQRGASIDELIRDDITGAPTAEALKDNFAAAYRAHKDAPTRAKLKAAYDKRLAVLTPGTLENYVEQINAAASAEGAQLLLDEASATLGPADLAELQQAFDARFPA